VQALPSGGESSVATSSNVSSANQSISDKAELEITVKTDMNEAALNPKLEDTIPEIFMMVHGPGRKGRLNLIARKVWSHGPYEILQHQTHVLSFLDVIKPPKKRTAFKLNVLRHLQAKLKKEKEDFRQHEDLCAEWKDNDYALYDEFFKAHETNVAAAIELYERELGIGQAMN